MADDFDGLWKKVHTMDEAEFIRTLAQILSSKEGRTFIFNLEPLDAALCIEILDRVSPNPSVRHPSVAHRCGNPIFRVWRCINSVDLRSKRSLLPCGDSQESTRDYPNRWLSRTKSTIPYPVISRHRAVSPISNQGYTMDASLR